MKPTDKAYPLRRSGRTGLWWYSCEQVAVHGRVNFPYMNTSKWTQTTSVVVKILVSHLNMKGTVSGGTSTRKTERTILLCWILSGKVKCTLVQALRLCTGRTTHRGSRGIVLPFHDHGTRRGWGVSVTPWPLFTPGKNPVPIVQEAGWAPGPAWTGAENLAPTGIRYPDRPAP